MYLFMSLLKDKNISKKQKCLSEKISLFSVNKNTFPHAKNKYVFSNEKLQTKNKTEKRLFLDSKLHICNKDQIS